MTAHTRATKQRLEDLPRSSAVAHRPRQYRADYIENAGLKEISSLVPYRLAPGAFRKE